MPEITRSPLYWPDNVPRTAPHRRGSPRFGLWSIAEAAQFVIGEINRLNRRPTFFEDGTVIVSSNLKYKLDGTPYSQQPEPADPGVAVYFHLRLADAPKERFRPVVLTCDKWNRVAWNLYAVAKDIEAQRGRLRWGCTNIEQSFRGYLAIPERTSGLAWWEILGINPAANEGDIKEAFRIKALTEHPDKGGTHERWTVLQTAYEQALAQISKP
jgi:DnaJ domain